MTKKQMLERIREEIYSSMNSWNLFSQIQYDETETKDTRKSAGHLARDYQTEALKLNKLCKEFFGIDAINEWVEL